MGRIVEFIEKHKVIQIIVIPFLMAIIFLGWFFAACVEGVYYRFKGFTWDSETWDYVNRKTGERIEGLRW